MCRANACPASTLTFNNGVARFLDQRGFSPISAVQGNFSLSQLSHLHLGEYEMLEIGGIAESIICRLRYYNVRMQNMHEYISPCKCIRDVLSSDAAVTAHLWGVTGGLQLTN